MTQNSNTQTLVSDDKLRLDGLRRAADLGDVEAQLQLGLIYYQGQQVTQDYKQAFAYFRAAAGQRHAAAQRNLGYMYAKGLGVREDPQLAVSWYRMAAEAGNASAQVNLGKMYLVGCGVPQDMAMAASWFKLAGAQGDAEGKALLAKYTHAAAPAASPAPRFVNTTPLFTSAPAQASPRRSSTRLIYVYKKTFLSFVGDIIASIVSYFAIWLLFQALGHELNVGLLVVLYIPLFAYLFMNHLVSNVSLYGDRVVKQGMFNQMTTVLLNENTRFVRQTVRTTTTHYVNFIKTGTSVSEVYYLIIHDGRQQLKLGSEFKDMDDLRIELRRLGCIEM